MLPQVNATLLSITRRSSSTGGYNEDYDREATPGTPVWQGSADAYVQRKIQSVFGAGGEQRRILVVTLYLDEDIPPGIEPGDTLVYTAGNPDSPQTLAGNAQNMVDPAMMSTVQDYYKVALEETNVPEGPDG